MMRSSQEAPRRETEIKDAGVGVGGGWAAGDVGDWQTWMRGERDARASISRAGCPDWVCVGGGCLTSIAPMTVAIPCINEKHKETDLRAQSLPSGQKEVGLPH